MTDRPTPAGRRRVGPVIGIVVAAVAVVALVVVAIVVFAPRQEAPPDAGSTPSEGPESTPDPEPTPTPTPTFDRQRYSLDDPTSLWVLVNKARPLNPPEYVPPDLVDVPVPYVYAPQMRQEAADRLVEMFQAFTAETGLQMQSQSAYRSYSTQVSVYNGWVSSLGQAGADLTSARPGYSEHQTGLVMDISAVPATCALDQCFAETPQGRWLAANAYRWGFIERYPEGKTDITGYEWEPWHFRYVGVELATEMHETGVSTMEEFFGLPAAPTYP